MVSGLMMIRHNDYALWLLQLSICLCAPSFFENLCPKILLPACCILLAVGVTSPEQGLAEGTNAEATYFLLGKH